MAWGTRGMNTEHSGGKDGKGHWGKREEAKRASKVRRRERERKLENQYEENYGEPLDDLRSSEGRTH